MVNCQPRSKTFHCHHVRLTYDFRTAASKSRRRATPGGMFCDYVIWNCGRCVYNDNCATTRLFALATLIGVVLCGLIVPSQRTYGGSCKSWAIR